MLNVHYKSSIKLYFCYRWQRNEHFEENIQFLVKPHIWNNEMKKKINDLFLKASCLCKILIIFKSQYVCTELQWICMYAYTFKRIYLSTSKCNLKNNNTRKLMYWGPEKAINSTFSFRVNNIIKFSH